MLMLSIAVTLNADYHYAVCCVVPEKVITQGRKQKILFATATNGNWIN